MLELELKEVLAAHALYLASNGQQGQQADLTEEADMEIVLESLLGAGCGILAAWLVRRSWR